MCYILVNSSNTQNRFVPQVGILLFGDVQQKKTQINDKKNTEEKRRREENRNNTKVKDYIINVQFCFS